MFWYSCYICYDLIRKEDGEGDEVVYGKEAQIVAPSLMAAIDWARKTFDTNDHHVEIVKATKGSRVHVALHKPSVAPQHGCAAH